MPPKKAASYLLSCFALLALANAAVVRAQSSDVDRSAAAKDGEAVLILSQAAAALRTMPRAI